MALTVLTNARDQKLIGYSNFVPCGHAGCAETLFLGDASLIAAVIFGLLIVCSKLRKLRQEKNFLLQLSTMDLSKSPLAVKQAAYHIECSIVPLRYVMSIKSCRGQSDLAALWTKFFSKF